MGLLRATVNPFRLTYTHYLHRNIPAGMFFSSSHLVQHIQFCGYELIMPRRKLIKLLNY